MAVGELTDTGLDVSTQAEVLEEIQDFQRAKISRKLSFDVKTPLGATNPIHADHAEQILDLLEEAYNAYDRDNATGDRLRALAIAIGCPPRGATPGRVIISATLGASLTFAAGDLVMAVEDEPTNLWENRDEVVTGAGGVLPVVFVSQVAGAEAIAAAGTLNQIPTTTAGFTAGTNAEDATPGFDVEAEGALRLRMAQTTAAGGQRTTAAVRSALVNIDGVLSVDVFENITAETDDQGVPAHSLHAVVWDGSPAGANDDEIAQAIWDRSGTYSFGTESGTAQDENLGAVAVNFDRATIQDITVEIDITSASGVAAEDVEDALLAAMPNEVGAAIVPNKLFAAVFDVEGVDDFDEDAAELDGAQDTLPADQLIIYRLLRANITVTGDAS